MILYGPSFLRDSYIAREQAAIRQVYLEFAAAPYNIRTVWLGFLTAADSMHPPTQELLSTYIPDGFSLYDAMCLGYPKNKFHRIPLRSNAVIHWV